MTTTKQSTAKPCAYFMGYSVCRTGPDKMADILQTAFPSSFFCLQICLFWLKIVLIRSRGASLYSE